MLIWWWSVIFLEYLLGPYYIYKIKPSFFRRVWHKSHSETVINLPQTVAYGKNNTKCCRIVTVFVNPKGLLGECGIITTSSMLHNYNTFKPTYPPLVPCNYSVIPYDYHTLQASPEPTHCTPWCTHYAKVCWQGFGSTKGIIYNIT